MKTKFKQLSISDVSLILNLFLKKTSPSLSNYLILTRINMILKVSHTCP
ncbi:hypothetical protein [Thermoanaerobacterium thermosaccharolyticum]